jgi:hypothetical protein
VRWVLIMAFMALIESNIWADDSRLTYFGSQRRANAHTSSRYANMGQMMLEDRN